MKVLTLFGTRPEVIKLAPVIRALTRRGDRLDVVNVTSAQHRELLYPFVDHFRLQLHHDLQVMRPDQTPSEVCARVLSALDPVLERESPDLVLVQGDTTTALAGAIAAFHRRIPVGHVEAGLRTDDPLSPFPEEMNRRLITRLARLHFAATDRNVETLRGEGVPAEWIVKTGNPVVDAVRSVLAGSGPSDAVDGVVRAVGAAKMVVLTTHRRESFGAVMEQNLVALREFVARREDVGLVFPVHPNPRVRRLSDALLDGVPRVARIAPLGYFDFIQLLSRAWLVVSDSGGVQEEAPTLGVPVLVIRDRTERPEAVEAGVARLVGSAPGRLAAMLDEAYEASSWLRTVRKTANPFGDGDSGERIAAAIDDFLTG